MNSIIIAVKIAICLCVFAFPNSTVIGEDRVGVMQSVDLVRREEWQSESIEVYPGEVKKIDLKFCPRFEGEKQILGIRTSCHCTIASNEPKKIIGGAENVISLSVVVPQNDEGQVEGRGRVTVEIITPGTDVKREVYSIVANLEIKEFVIIEGGVQEGIMIRNAAEGNCQKLVLCPGPYSEKWDAVSASSDLPVAALGLLVETCGSEKYTMTATVPQNTVYGIFSGETQLSFTYNGNNKKYVKSIPTVVRKYGNLRASPGWLSINRNERYEGSITVRDIRPNGDVAGITIDEKTDARIQIINKLIVDNQLILRCVVERPQALDKLTRDLYIVLRSDNDSLTFIPLIYRK